MNSFQKNKLAFILAFLFLSSVSAEELLHEHHDDHDYIAAELDCNFCTEITPEFNIKINTFGDLYFSNYYLIENAENQFSENIKTQFFSRGPPAI